MKISDKIKLYGGLLISKNGEEPVEIQNIVCSVGRQKLASHAATLANAQYWFSHLAVGSGILPVSTEDLALDDEIYRVQFDSIFASNYTVYGTVEITGLMIDAYVGVGPGVGEYFLTEWGLMDSLTGGNLICHQVPDYQFDVQGDDILEIIWGVIIT